MLRSIGVMLLLAISACADSGAPSRADTEDFSYIEDPRERWRAYRITDYRINQTRGCECLPPGSWTAVIRSAEIVDAVTQESYPGYTDEEMNARARTFAWTVEEMFDLIDSAKANAYRYQVDYHPKFGYPTLLSVDWYDPIADDEIYQRLENLERL